MRTSPAVLLLLVAGCAKPAPVPAPAAPKPAVPAPVAAPAAVTCADAGVLMRGGVDDQKQAGPAKEAAIARTCRLEKWTPAVLKCVGEKPQARACLSELAPSQRTAYEEALVAWNEVYPDEVIEEAYSGDDYTDSVDAYIDCGDAIHSVGLYAPAVTLAGADADYALELRERALSGLCEDWEYDRRACFRDLSTGGGRVTTAGIDACRAQLDAALGKAVTDKLAEVDKLAGKVAALRKTPASHDCKKVVAVHYADAAWKGKLDAVKGAERAKAIAESRAKMAKACTDEKWPQTARACAAAGGAAETCFAPIPSGAALWGFPAAGVFVKSGIPECDAYATTIKAVDACTALPQSQRDAIKRSWGYLSTSWASAPPERRAQTAQSCKSVDEAIKRSVAGAGCKI